MTGDEQPTLVPVGIAYTPYGTAEDAPHQGFADDAEATVEVFERYADALSGVENVVRLTVIYWADRADRSALRGDDGVGAFARRSPHRPNPVNVCTCLLLSVDGRRLRIRGLDAVDGSLVLDLKPALQAER